MTNLQTTFDKTFTALKKNDKIAIYHDADPDGTCSAVILAKAIHQQRGKYPDYHLSPTGGERFLPDETINNLKKKKVTILFTTDIALDEHPEQLKKASEFARIIVFDHHKLYHDVNNERILLIKPQLFTTIDPSKYCTSKLIYDYCSRHADLKNNDWIAAVGIISDMTADEWKDYLTQTFARHSYPSEPLPRAQDYFNTPIGTISKLISSAEVYDEKNVNLCYNLLLKAKKPDDIIKSKLTKFEQAISTEINTYLENTEKNAEIYPNLELIYYHIQPKYNIKSPLCTLASIKYHDKTILLITTIDGRAHVSARRHDRKLAVNDLLEKACKKIPNSNAGGHIPAAGATFPAQHLPEFKKRIITILRKRIKKGKNLNTQIAEVQK